MLVQKTMFLVVLFELLRLTYLCDFEQIQECVHRKIVLERKRLPNLLMEFTGIKQP